MYAGLLSLRCDQIVSQAPVSTHEQQSATPLRWRVPMVGRSPTEGHRASTPLELFFDLVFVVAVAQVSAALHHAIAEGHSIEGVLKFAAVFFAIWWAWMNFTWFASAYDTDDVPYRLTTFVQLIGALILAAGVPQAFADDDFGLITAGYTLMRLALVTQWLRAAHDDPAHRVTARRFALGVALLQLGWIGRLWLPHGWQMPAFVVLVACELAVPLWAERARPTTWHPGHIAERYGLFTMIVLGEVILSSSLAIQSARQAGALNSQLVEVIVGAIVMVLAMWWLYFDQPVDDMLTSTRVGFIWGYGHLLIFAAVASVGAGLAVQIDYATQHAELDALAAGAAVAIPVALYVVGLLLMHQRRVGDRAAMQAVVIAAAALVSLSALSGHAVILSAVVLVALAIVKRVVRHHDARRGAYEVSKHVTGSTEKG
jgi:low temperature requirement protein LtrA